MRVKVTADPGRFPVEPSLYLRVSQSLRRDSRRELLEAILADLAGLAGRAGIWGTQTCVFLRSCLEI